MEIFLNEGDSSHSIKNEDMSVDNEREGNRNSCWIGLLLLYSLPIAFVLVIYGIPNLIDALNKVRISNKYTIEYMESHKTKCLYNGAQIFVYDPKIAYWNKDTLLLSDGYDCYLFELDKRIYNDQMKKVPCVNLNNILWQQPIEIWREN